MFLTWGLGMRPGWRLYGFAAAATALWALLMLGFNALAGTNYLYVNSKPAEASILDALGPWPWYLAAESALILLVWALITWPWRKGESLSGPPRSGSLSPR